MPQIKISWYWRQNRILDPRISHCRSQTVIVNETPSSPCNIVSSVPQGTVLGPILFIILLIDINKDITCKLSSFADDTRVMKPIFSNLCSHTLQNDLNTIYSWQVENNMMFNEDKFEHLRYIYITKLHKTH